MLAIEKPGDDGDKGRAESERTATNSFLRTTFFFPTVTECAVSCTRRSRRASACSSGNDDLDI